MLAGRSLPHALMMMVPEAYRGRPDVSEELRGFYAFHECLTEAWDGPAAIAFSDGRVLGAMLDRNGLRPGRWLETHDGWVILASEAGVLDIPPADVLRKGRLQPGKLFLVDLERGRIVPDHELKQQIATQRPYAEWFAREHVSLGDLPSRPALRPRAEPLRRLQLAFGYTQEDMKVMLAPLAVNAEEAIGSMGNDTPLAVLSDRRPLLYSYFKQLFAQVTNPPIDSTREAVVMSVGSLVGSERNLLDETPAHARQLVIENPILRDDQLESLRQVDSEIFKAQTLDITWPADDGVAGLESALERLCADADRALAAGTNILVLSDRAVGAERAPIPSLLAVGAVHHHLVRSRDSAADGPRRRIRRTPERAERGRSDRIRRCCRQPVSDVGHDRSAGRRGEDRALSCGGPGPRGQGDRQGPPQGDLEDGHLDALLLLRCTGLRSGRSRPGADRALLHRNAVEDRWDRSHRDRRGRARAPSRARFPTTRAKTSCRWSASTRGGKTASTINGIPRRSRCSSTRFAAVDSRRTTSSPPP